MTSGVGVGTSGSVPIFSRKATGLVREVGILDQTLFNAASTNPLGAALVFGLFTLILFPRANVYWGMVIALVCGMFVWVTFAVMSAAIPKIGGDYTFNSRILTPWVGFAGNLSAFISSVIAAGLWAYWVATQGLSPIFTVIGSVTGSSAMTSLGTFFGAGNPTVVFLTSIAALAITSGLAVLGTRVIMRVMTILFIIAAAGFLVDFVILLFTSNDSFKSIVDSVGGSGAYQKTIDAGKAAGMYPSNGGYSLRSTIGAVYYTLTVTIWVWWGTYLSAEFKGAGQRKRQLTSMIGAGLGQGLLVLLAIVIFLNTVGYNFFVSALSGNFAAAGGTVGTAGYAYFSALVARNPFLVSLTAMAFLGWWLPGLYINSAMAQRALFTWSFDGLLPKKIGEVSERYHTPVVAIAISFVFSVLAAAWVSYSSNFFQVFAIMVLFAYAPIVLVGLSAMLMKSRRPDLYSGTSALWKVGGIEVLPIAGAGCFLVGVGAVGLALYFHTELSIPALAAVLAPIGVFAGAYVWWLVAKSVRKSQGIDLSLAYKEIPPD
jgi:amino acid transporter